MILSKGAVINIKSSSPSERIPKESARTITSAEKRTRGRIIISDVTREINMNRYETNLMVNMDHI